MAPAGPPRRSAAQPHLRPAARLSDKRANRPKLAQALKVCRVHRARLIIAKLDRLARNVAFVSNLLESGVEFEAVDFPQANRLTVHILAAFAEHEGRLISERTKAALAAAKARGVKLGGDRGGRFTAKARAAGSKARAKIAKQRAVDIAPTIEEIREAGATSLHAIAAALNERGVPTASGRGKWGASQIRRMRLRLEPPSSTQPPGASNGHHGQRLGHE
jgi:DNA invertase Pin-like site-specific DNA recombinase